MEKFYSQNFNFSRISCVLAVLFMVVFTTAGKAQNVTVNPGGGSYATLKAAFDAINLGTHTGAITVDIVGNTTETATAILNASGTGSASYSSISIQPSGGAARTVSGAIVAGSPLVDLNGADNVTIDGLNSGGNSLTIANTTASATSGTSTMRFIGGATNNTVTRCSVQGSFSASVITNGGNIFFSTDAVTANGNDNNTISFCDIGPAGSNLSTKGIYSNGSTSTTAINNSGILINSNNIFDYFGAAVTSAGIYIGGGTTDCSFTNNKLYQTATRTQTAGAAHAGIWISNSTSGNNFQITGNTIGFANSSGTGTYTFVGFSSTSTFMGINLSVGTTTATNVQANTIAGISVSGAVSGTSSSSAFRGIYVGSGLTTIGDITGNIIGSQSITGSITFTSSSTSASDVNGIFNFGSSNWTTNNNTVGGITASNSSTGAANIYGIRANTGSTVTWTCNNNTIGGSIANSIQSTTTATGTVVVGILNSNPIGTITGNIIRNLTSAGGTGTGATASISGIASVSTANQTISGNILSGFSSSGPSTVNGISITAGAVVNILKNKLYDLQVNNAAGLIVSGLAISGGTTINATNNLIGDLKAPISSNNEAIRGIGITSTTASSTININYNTVYINATSTGTNFGTSGIFHTGSTTATTATLVLKNNIITNTSTPAGTGFVVAHRRGTINLQNYSTGSNNNLFYSGTPSASALIYYDGTNADQTLAAYATRVAPADALSITEFPSFISTTGASPDFLHINTATPTAIESGGAMVSGITDDYDGNTRHATTPDIGADEFAGTPLSCTGTPAMSNAVVTPTPPLCNGQTFTVSLDVVYIGVTYQWQSSGDNSNWTNISGATFSTLVTSTSLTTYYRAIITCPNSGLSNNSNSVQVTIFATLSGTYTIDNTLPTSGTNYNNFVDAVAALNCRGISASVIFDVTANQTFLSSDSLNITVTGTSGNTITFQKNGGGANPKIQRLGNAATTNYILRIGGGDYFTFNGIDFEQTGASAANWVEYGVFIQNASSTNGAKNNTFKNGTVAMANANNASRGVYVIQTFAASAVSGTNSSNRFLNMTIQNSYEGYRISGASAFSDTDNEISTEMSGLSSIQTLGNGTVINTVYGVFATYQRKFKVKNTEISYLSPGGTSTAYGILLSTSASDTAEISGNHIHDISGGGILYGISATSGDTVTIFNNNIYTLASSTTTSSTIRGIDIGTTTMKASIYGNIIYDLSSTGATTTTVAGIDIGSGLSYKVHNNMISDLRAPASTTTTGGIKGIATSGSTTGQIARIYYNTVVLADVATASAYTSAGFYNSNSTPVIDFRNNMIVNKSDVTAGTRAVAYWKNNTTINQDANTNNNLYYAGTPGSKNLLYYDGTNAAQNIPAIHAITGMSTRESLSVSEDVDFDPIGNGIIRPDPLTASKVESGGQVIAGYTVDFENNARGPYPLGAQANGGGFAPDLGADEGDFTYLPPPVPDCPTLNSPSNAELDVCHYQTLALSWTPAPTGGLVTLGYDVYFGTNPTPPFVVNTSLISYSPTGLLPNTTYYWKIVPKNNTGEAENCATNSFTTVNIGVTSTTPGSRCGLGTVMLGATGNGTLNWYAAPAGGTTLGTGTSFVTPIINTTTNFYVAASGGMGAPINLGKPNRTDLTANTSTNTGLVFSAPSGGILESVYVYPSGTGAGTLKIVLKTGNTSSATRLDSVTVNITGVPIGGATKTLVPLNFNVPAGTGYYLSAEQFTGGLTGLGRELTGGGPYPYTAAGTDWSITGSWITTGAPTTTTYYYFYDWILNQPCTSPRTTVVATVTPSDPILLTPSSVTRCQLEAATSIMASSSYAYNYTWSPSTGLNTTSGATVLANPNATTTYTVTGDDGTCANTATVTVTVNIPPTNPLASATPNPVCPGTVVNLNSSADNCTVAFMDISTTGTSVPGALGDDTEHNITIPSFTFDGNNYTTARIGVNGLIVLGSTTGDVSDANAALPSTVNTAGNIFLAPYWDDLDIQTSLTIKTQTVGNKFIIQYTNAAHDLFTTGSITFQVQLNLTSGVITFVYQDVIFGNATYDSGASATVGIQYSGTSAQQYSFNTASLSNGQCISFPSATITYSWAGPNGFTSAVQNPGLGAVTALNVGIYTVTFTDQNNCSSTANVDLVVNDLPTISLGTNPAVCLGATTADLTYSSTTGSPNEYSIDYNPAAQAQGFVDVVNAILPTSPITLTVPGAAALGTYNATLTVKNTSTGCVSSSSAITVTINDSPNAGIVNGTSPLCINATTTYSSTGNAGGTWSSTNPSVASVHLTTGLVTALTAGTTDITYTTAANSCGPQASSFKTLTVNPVIVTNTADSGAGSLRDIIACAGTGATITFDAALLNATIILTSEIVIDKNLTIAGLGMLNLTLSGNNTNRIFKINAGQNVTLEDLALKNANSITNGGAVYVLGNLTLENVLLDDNFENGTSTKSMTVAPTAMVTIIGNVNLNE